jgi:hypothetical protein
MANESSDPITAAMIETEKEVAGFAWDNEETEAADPSGDQSLEDMGDGLEGQHEAEDDVDGEEAEGEEVSEDEAAAAKAKADEGEQPKPVTTEQPQGRVPPGEYRKVSERARAAEAERDTLKAAFDRREAESKAQLDLVMREIAALKTAPRSDVKPEPPKPEVVPDIFENPPGFVDHITKQFEAKLAVRDKQIADQRLETSMTIAHTFHKGEFEKAWEAVNALNPADPETRTVVDRIKASPNPGESLMTWHKREQTRAEVGDDFVAYRERIRNEEREAMKKDPEIRKQILAEMRGEAATGENGSPRTTTRLPPSLGRAAGSNVGTGRADPRDQDDSQQSIADAAWR